MFVDGTFHSYLLHLHGLFITNILPEWADGCGSVEDIMLIYKVVIGK